MVSANNAINDTVGASISGVTNSLTITNPSNTASSAARNLITVGGGTAGDPYTNYNVNGVTDWSMGIDNGSSDILKMSQNATLGTNDVWTMTTGGQRNLPMQSCFSAYLSASQANKTGDGTVYTVIFDTVNFDINTDYDNTTGEYTAPIDGKYLINCTLGLTNCTSAHRNWVIQINVNGSAAIQVVTVYNPFPILTATPGLGATQLSGSTILDLTMGDTVSIVTGVQGGTKVVGIYGGALETQVSGFLLA